MKQIVDLGDQNENHVLIRKGLSENDNILLTAPDDPEDLPFEGMMIYQEIKERKLREAQEAKEEEREKTMPFSLQNERKFPGNNRKILQDEGNY